MTRLSLAAIALAVLCLTAGPSKATPITLDFTLKGSFSQGGLNNAAFGAGPGNTLVGGDSAGSHNAYWVFDLAGIGGHIVSATLRLGNPFFGYISSDPTETLTVFDYTGDIALLQNQSTHSTAAFSDLGSGDSYGSRAVSAADVPDCSGGCTIDSFFPVDIALGGADFVADANAARGGLFALGGALTTVVPGGASELMFAFTGNNIPAQLILETGPAPLPVPEPSSLVLAAAGLLGLGFLRRAERRVRRTGSR